jgi:hypothetical protein
MEFLCITNLVCVYWYIVINPTPFEVEVEIAIAKLKNYELPAIDQILADLIQAGGEILRSEIHNLF